MEIFQGSNKLGNIKKINDVRLGKSYPYLIFQGDKLIYPKLPITATSVDLWYDFHGYSNEDILNNTNLYTLSDNRYNTKIELDGSIIEDATYISSNFIEV